MFKKGPRDAKPPPSPIEANWVKIVAPPDSKPSPASDQTPSTSDQAPESSHSNGVQPALMKAITSTLWKYDVDTFEKFVRLDLYREFYYHFKAPADGYDTSYFIYRYHNFVRVARYRYKVGLCDIPAKLIGVLFTDHVFKSDGILIPQTGYAFDHEIEEPGFGPDWMNVMRELLEKPKFPCLYTKASTLRAATSISETLAQSLAEKKCWLDREGYHIQWGTTV